MCIIIYRPRGAESRVSKETLARCAVQNHDGYGLMWSVNGELHTARYTKQQQKKFFRHYLTVQEADLPVAAHFRYATHGAHSVENCHPFILRDGYSAVMHNGVIDIACPTGWSDTRAFVEQVLAPLPAEWWHIPALRYLVERACKGSKLAIMHAGGEVDLVHEKAGIWDKGIWYSNGGYLPLYSLTAKAMSAAEALEWWAKEEAKSKAKAQAAKAVKPHPRHSARESKSGKYAKAAGALYFYEGLVLCSDCLRMEHDAAKAATMLQQQDGEECELCHFTR